MMRDTVYNTHNIVIVRRYSFIHGLHLIVHLKCMNKKSVINSLKIPDTTYYFYL